LHVAGSLKGVSFEIDRHFALLRVDLISVFTSHSEEKNNMNRFAAVLFLSGLSCVVAYPSAFAVTIDTVPVGDIGNANDPVTGNLYGGVNYAYRIGRYEVTNDQYAAFLNAKATSDSLGLYNAHMTNDPWGGIIRNGVSGAYTYAPKTSMGNKPVNFVSWYDAIRFANWLNNGQGTGDTESGAYTILGGTPTPSNGPAITRNVGATWFLPSDNEWYKAAYYQPAAQGGDADGYWRYPTASNIQPTMATAINLIGPTRGDIGNPGENVANYGNGADWNGLDGNLTTVGSAGPLSESFYGTSDQGGNVWEFNELSLIGPSRGLRGGDAANAGFVLQSQSYNGSAADPTSEDLFYGFRVATVPEPSSLFLSGFGLAALALCNMRVCNRRERAKILELH
jgi:formylglycine-generating enzyme